MDPVSLHQNDSPRDGIISFRLRMISSQTRDACSKVVGDYLLKSFAFSRIISFRPFTLFIHAIETQHRAVQYFCYTIVQLVFISLTLAWKAGIEWQRDASQRRRHLDP